jgi:hypothetical protein
MDLNGKVHQTFKPELSDVKMTIPTKELVSGLYILHLILEGSETERVKILIK